MSEEELLVTLPSLPTHSSVICPAPELQCFPAGITQKSIHLHNSQCVSAAFGKWPPSKRRWHFAADKCEWFGTILFSLCRYSEPLIRDKVALTKQHARTHTHSHFIVRPRETPFTAISVTVHFREHKLPLELWEIKYNLGAEMFLTTAKVIWLVLCW